MPRVEFSPSALKALEKLIETRELPADTRARVARSVRLLAEFPEAGSPLDGDWSGFRFLLGPWLWMLIVYALVGDDLVAVVTIEDSRSAGSVISTHP